MTKEKGVGSPSITYRFFSVPTYEQDFIKDIVQKNIQGKADSYLKGIYSKNKDAEVKIDYKIQKNKQNRYEASFRFHFDGQAFVYQNKTAFKYTADLVNHAFKRFVESLSSKK